MVKKKIDSVEKLAIFTARELDSLRTNVRQGFHGLREGMRGGFKALADSLDLIRQDLRDIKIVLGPLVRTVADLESIVARIEKRVGLAK